MIIKINNREIPCQGVEFYNWFHLVDWLLRNHISHRHGIVELTVDGTDYRPILSDLNALPFPSRMEQIIIETRDAYAISESGLNKIDSLLRSIIKEIEPISSHFRSGKLPQGSTALGQLLKSMVPMIDFIHSLTQNFQIDYSIIIASENLTIQDLLNQFQLFFESLTSAQERSDSIELADLIEYELSPMINHWQNAIQQLRQALPLTPLKTPS